MRIKPTAPYLQRIYPACFPSNKEEWQTQLKNNFSYASLTLFHSECPKLHWVGRSECNGDKNVMLQVLLWKVPKTCFFTEIWTVFPKLPPLLLLIQSCSGRILRLLLVRMSCSEDFYTIKCIEDVTPASSRTIVKTISRVWTWRSLLTLSLFTQ